MSGHFLALMLESPTPEALQSLTPEVMNWAPGVWLWDLTPVQSYWQRRASAEGAPTLVALWRRHLHRWLHPRRDGVIALAPSVRIVHASHPWAALLGVYGMAERQLAGFRSLAGKEGEAARRDLWSWPGWGKGWRQLIGHGFGGPSQAAKLQQQNRQLMRLCPQLGLHSPADLERLSPAQIQRRFGSGVKTVWGWVTGRGEGTPFPWQRYTFAEGPQVRRYLDQPLSTWEGLPALLAEDCQRLAAHLPERARVLSLEWTLILDDLCHHPRTLSFRTPHRLQDHEAVEQQARYSLREPLPRPVGGWQLAVSQMMVPPPWQPGLFGGEVEAAERDIGRLSNELAAPLERFHPSGYWPPEESYGAAAGAELPAGWQALQRERPLLVLHRPQPLATPPPPARRVFLETVTASWWRDDEPTWERHYYRAYDREERCWWVFQDAAGRWFRHGIF